jgi:hypothetical protein
LLSFPAERTKHRQDYVVDEWGVKQEASRQTNDEDGENPIEAQQPTCAGWLLLLALRLASAVILVPTRESVRPAESGAFKQNRDALEYEINGRQPISAAGRDRDDQFVHETRKKEHDQDGDRNTEPTGNGPEREMGSNVVEGCIPAFAPELADT